MELFCLSHSAMEFSIICKFTNIKDIWLLNCYEGCQHFFLKHHLKINQISKIFITNLNIQNISGLLGLLSSLNLISRVKPIHIYGPDGLQEYLDLGKKYSRTNFTYAVNIYLFRTILIVDYHFFRLYCTFRSKNYKISLIFCERSGQFRIDKAINWHLNQGPLYGKLKLGMVFLLPDGIILSGLQFTLNRHKGSQISIFSNLYSTRYLVEETINTRVINAKI